MKLFNKNKLPSSEAIRYAEKQTKIYKQQVIKATNDYIRIQSNWNNLKEYYKRKVEETKDSTSLYDKWIKYSSVLYKMNELEGEDR